MKALGQKEEGERDEERRQKLFRQRAKSALAFKIAFKSNC